MSVSGYGLPVGSREWVQAIETHYSTDPDIMELCKCYRTALDNVKITSKLLQGYETAMLRLNVLTAHSTELVQQLGRALGTIADMTKEKVDGEGHKKAE